MTTKNRTVGKELTTSNSNVYVVPPRHLSSVYSIFITNTSSSATTVSLDWYDAEAAVYYSLARLMTLPGNSALQITEALYLQPNDIIRGLAGANSAVTVSVKVEETYTPSLIN